MASEGLWGAEPHPCQPVPSSPVPPTVPYCASESQQERENWKLGSFMNHLEMSVGFAVAQASWAEPA